MCRCLLGDLRKSESLWSAFSFLWLVCEGGADLSDAAETSVGSGCSASLLVECEGLLCTLTGISGIFEDSHDLVTRCL